MANDEDEFDVVEDLALGGDGVEPLTEFTSEFGEAVESEDKE